MIRTVVKDEFFLSLPGEKAGPSDLSAAADLIDTLQANRAVCVGMAANMIGIRKRIIAVSAGNVMLCMLNPVITAKSGPYEAEEGCLSLSGVRRTTRYQKIEVQYQDLSMRKKKQTFTGWTAQIIQHEIDHCNGIVI